MEWSLQVSICTAYHNNMDACPITSSTGVHVLMQGPPEDSLPLSIAVNAQLAADCDDVIIMITVRNDCSRKSCA